MTVMMIMNISNKLIFKIYHLKIKKMSVELYKTFELCCETLDSKLTETITNGNELIIFIQNINKNSNKYDSNLNVFNYFIKTITRNSILKTSDEVWKNQLNEIIDIIGNVLKNATDIQLNMSIISITGLSLTNQKYDKNMCTFEFHVL